MDLQAVDTTEGAAILDRTARRLLNIGGADFLERWDRGDIEGLDHTAVMKLSMLIPLAR